MINTASLVKFGMQRCKGVPGRDIQIMQAKFQGKENTNKPSTVIGTLLERLLKQKK